MRKFEKISFKQFKKDIKNDKKLYENYTLPKRSTKTSAGYDFFAIEEFKLSPGEIKKVPTGIKVQMNENEVLFLIVRSSMGFKYNVRMCNQVGVIDHDYYNNIDNEGHFWVALKNEGEKDYRVKQGEAFVQGIFINYLTVDNEEEIKEKRTSGLGSTSRKKG